MPPRPSIIKGNDIYGIRAVKMGVGKGYDSLYIPGIKVHSRIEALTKTVHELTAELASERALNADLMAEISNIHEPPECHGDYKVTFWNETLNLWCTLNTEGER
jgi:hypothetical protein